MRYDRVYAAGRVLAGDVLPTLVALAVLLGGSTGAAHNAPAGRADLDATAYAILGVAGIAFVLRRHLPLALLAVETGVAGTYLAITYPHGPIEPAVGVAALFVAMRHPPKVAAAAGGVAALTMFGSDLVGSGAGTVTDVLAASTQLGWAVIPTIVGALLRVARSARREAVEEARRREVDEERLRLARDVHDVVGHGLSVISLHAGVALHVLERQPEQARVALEAIRRASTDALDELRTTLALARDDSVARRTPLSGLDRLPGLVTEVRLCGLPVGVHVDGPEQRLPADVDQVAFRVVQESLTNALRHSGGSRVDVTLQHEPGRLRVVVEDDGRPLHATPAPAGHGLAGLRERVTGIGGTFSAGPRDGGGWRVEAVLPLAAVAAETVRAPR